jgi:hypothetical protein
LVWESKKKNKGKKWVLGFHFRFMRIRYWPLTAVLLHMARLERGMEMHGSSVICLFLTLRVKSLVQANDLLISDFFLDFCNSWNDQNSPTSGYFMI